MKAVATGSQELKWTKNAEVSVGTVEHGAGIKERRKQGPQ